jgi:hypothetical protein
MKQGKAWLILPILAYTIYENGDKEITIGWLTRTYSVRFKKHDPYETEK